MILYIYLVNHHGSIGIFVRYFFKLLSPKYFVEHTYICKNISGFMS